MANSQNAMFSMIMTLLLDANYFFPLQRTAKGRMEKQMKQNAVCEVGECSENTTFFQRLPKLLPINVNWPEANNLSYADAMSNEPEGDAEIKK